MRTTLDIDERLLKKAMLKSKTYTKKEAVERGLRELIRTELCQKLLKSRVKGYGMNFRSFLRSRLDK